MRVLTLGWVDATGGGIDPTRYSRYKYGDVCAVGAFGRALADLAIAELPALVTGPVTVTAPASRAVPIGADLLADEVLRSVNDARTDRGTHPAIRAKLHRHHIPEGDYGRKGVVGRRAVLAGERISSIPELFTDRQVLVVDDLWVTGVSAEVTAAAVARWRPASVTYLVIARVAPAFAEQHPELEHELNHAAIDGLPALTALLDSTPVIVNQRLCKFLLAQPGERLAAWLPTQPPQFVWRLYCAVLAEGFGLMPAYRSSVELLVGYADRAGLDEQAAAEGWIGPAPVPGWVGAAAPAQRSVGAAPPPSPPPVRLVSFDLWSTLAAANPTYKQRRTDLVATAFGVDQARAGAALDVAEEKLDRLTTETGRQYGFPERVRRTGALLGCPDLSDARLRALFDELRAAFLHHPPALADPTLPDTLTRLRRLGVRIAVTSNTGFIPGHLVRRGLERLGLLVLIDHLVFSDEVGRAKPAGEIYRRLAAVAGCRPDEIVHVGDDRANDYAGARAAGLRALWYRPGGPPDSDVLLHHRDLVDHPWIAGPTRT